MIFIFSLKFKVLIEYKCPNYCLFHSMDCKGSWEMSEACCCWLERLTPNRPAWWRRLLKFSLPSALSERKTCKLTGDSIVHEICSFSSNAGKWYRRKNNTVELTGIIEEQKSAITKDFHSVFSCVYERAGESAADGCFLTLCCTLRTKSRQFWGVQCERES